MFEKNIKLNSHGNVLRDYLSLADGVEALVAAINFSEAMGEGVSGKQASAYTVGKFGEDILNLPGMVAGGTKWVKEKLNIETPV